MNKRKMNTLSDEMTPNGLGFFQQEQISTLSRFFLDEEIGEPSYYRNLLQVLLSANDNDVIELWINSSGGDLSSAEAIMSAISSTEATVVAIVNGKAYSAASMIMLACHEIVIMPTASVMCHEASWVSAGKGSDQKAYTEFSTKKIDKLIEDVYEGFLSASEIHSVKNGKEIWLVADEVNERLSKRSDYFQAKWEAEQKAIEEENKPAPVPERQPRKRRTPVVIED